MLPIQTFLAQEIFEDLEAALKQFREIAVDLVQRAADFLWFVDHSLNMYGALKVAGNRQARLEVIPGAGHFFERGFSGYLFDEVTKLVVPWFDDTVKGSKR